MWGYPHALSHEGLRAINEFAEAELTAMVMNEIWSEFNVAFRAKRR